MKLEGTLDTFPLRELIDMVTYSSVTGVLNIFGPGEPGHIYFRDGVLYHAERGATQGVEALAEMLEFHRATFTFVSDVKVEAESIWGSLNQLLQSAERLAMRWRQIRAYVPTMDLVPALLSPREGVVRRVGPAHYPVLTAIDGTATLRQIAAQVGWAEVDVAEAIAQMALDGLIDLRPLRSVVVAEGSNGASQCAESGVFDRILGRPHVASRATPPRASEPTEPARPVTFDTRNQEELILKLLRG